MTEVKNTKKIAWNRLICQIMVFMFYVLLIRVTCKIVEMDFATIGETVQLNIAATFIIGSVFAVVTLPFFVFKRYAASAVSDILYSLAILAESGLAIHLMRTGSLLGCELVARPFAEQYNTLMAVAPLPFIIAMLLVFAFLYNALVVFVEKRAARVMKLLALVCFIHSVAFVATTARSFIDSSPRVVNKTLFAVYECGKYLKEKLFDDDTHVEYDEQMVERFLHENSDFVVPDKDYPLEREDNIADALSPYFDSCDTKPNVVMLIVESLGHEFMNPCFAPFIDSLARTGLYWENCFSTTRRSFGAVPAITGSVAGPRSFQFGSMPDHNSLISILNGNGYRTNAFYAGYFTFDCIYEYLLAQHIDYMSPYYSQYKSENNPSRGTTWGYHDAILFGKAMDEIEQMTEAPEFDMFVTLSTHDGLQLSDKDSVKMYESRADSILKLQRMNSKAVNRYAAMLYTDDCIRDFMRRYSKLDKFKNTIFVITGDHSSGLRSKNDLSFHHVPLVVWSPLLAKHQTFRSFVTHNDITPSLVKLLQSKYGLSAPGTVHWVGDGLDTAVSVMNKNKVLQIVGYDRVNKSIIYKNHYFHQQQGVFDIDDDLNLTLEVNENDDKYDSLLSMYKYIYKYTYTNNRLTKNTMLQNYDYKPLFADTLKNELVCVTPPTKPSENGNEIFWVMEEKSLDKMAGFKMARIELECDLFFCEKLDIDSYMSFVFKNRTDNYTTHADERVVKFVNSEDVEARHNYHIKISKEMQLDTASDNRLSVAVITVNDDNTWVPNSTMIMQNITISLGVSE